MLPHARLTQSTILPPTCRHPQCSAPQPDPRPRSAPPLPDFVHQKHHQPRRPPHNPLTSRTWRTALESPLSNTPPSTLSSPTPSTLNLSLPTRPPAQHSSCPNQPFPPTQRRPPTALSRLLPRSHRTSTDTRHGSSPSAPLHPLPFYPPATAAATDPPNPLPPSNRSEFNVRRRPHPLCSLDPDRYSAAHRSARRTSPSQPDRSLSAEPTPPRPLLNRTPTHQRPTPHLRRGVAAAEHD
jgi:hypothetical protein